MSKSVEVTNISGEVTEKETKDFFSFCGKITSFTTHLDEATKTQTAKVTFERTAAAKTALLLDNTKLGANQVKVTIIDDGSTEPETHEEGEDLKQEDKPRTAIFAEYLSHGYTIGDQTLQKAIELDNHHGISSRFISALKNFDDRFKATDKAKGIDNTYGVTGKATAGWNTLNQYFEKAIDTPTGQKVRSFYLTGQKQVLDIHAEARRLAELRKQEAKKDEPEKAEPEKTEPPKA